MYRLTDAHLRTAGGFTHVTALDLSQCAVTGLAPLARLPRLRSLECNWCTRLEPASLRALAGLAQLTKLDLSGCARAATDEGLHILACAHTICISLCIFVQNKATPSPCAHASATARCLIGTCFLCRNGYCLDTRHQHRACVRAGRSGSLEWLSLQCCPRFTSRGLAAIARFSRLRYLDMSETSVRSVRCLAACRCLASLRLSGCAALQDGALAGLAALPKLAALDLRRSRQLLTDDTMRELCALSGEPLPDRVSDTTINMQAHGEGRFNCASRHASPTHSTALSHASKRGHPW